MKKYHRHDTRVGFEPTTLILSCEKCDFLALSIDVDGQSEINSSNIVLGSHCRIVYTIMRVTFVIILQVVQRRYNGSVNFNRSWADYKDGFGSMDREFWLGNEILHNLTDTEGNWTIRLDLTNEQNKTDHLIETPFHVGLDDYTLFVEHSGIQPTGL